MIARVLWSSLLAASIVACQPRATASPDAAPTSHAAASTSAPVSSAAPVRPDENGMRIEDERNTIGVFRAAAQSTVFVTQTRTVVDYWQGTQAEVPAGTGSGFVWDEAGHIVTNFHVVQGAESLSVTLRDQKTYPARIVGVEPRKDIAVLKIDAPGVTLVPIKQANPKDPLDVGQKTIAIGNPFGLDHTLTTGVVSAVGRQMQGVGGVTIRDMIQTDAAINPGNSGGPLLDSAGRLIGMNTMIYSRSGASAGIGFAVPISSIARVVPQIIKTGRAEQVGFGVSIDPAQRLERRFGIRGVVVHSVVPKTPAAKAGIRGITRTATGLALGDVIVGIDDKPIADYDDLYTALDTKKPGDQAVVKVQRGQETANVPVELIVVDQGEK
jgi:S1-C subfamily serine protease